MTAAFQVFNTTAPSQFFTATPVAQPQILPWWTESPSSILDFLFALYAVTWGFDTLQQPMFSGACRRRRRRRERDTLPGCAESDMELDNNMGHAGVIAADRYRSPGPLQRFGQWHDDVWGRPNLWHFKFWHKCWDSDVLWSYWELVGLISTFCQVISGMAYLHNNRTAPELIQPPTGNSYLELFAVVTMIFSARIKSNMFTFFWMWINVLLTFAFQVLLNVLPNHKTSPAPMFELRSDYCVMFLGNGELTDYCPDVGSFAKCGDIMAEQGVKDALNIAAVPWSYNLAFIALLFIGTLIGLCTYWWPEKFKFPGDAFRFAILLTLGISAVSFTFQALQQKKPIHLDFLVCPHVSNSTTGTVTVDSSCVCQTFREAFVPASWKLVLEDAVLSRFVYNVI